MKYIAKIPPILMARLRSDSYKIKMKKCTLEESTLESEILSQCGESYLKGFNSQT